MLSVEQHAKKGLEIDYFRLGYMLHVCGILYMGLNCLLGPYSFF